MTAACVCPPATTDCTGSRLFLRVDTQPALAVPRAPFGQQPVVRLVDAAGNTVKESGTKVRLSIANAQDSACRCVGDTPCRYTAAGDMVCPPGTEECLPAQAAAKLYQKDVEENPNDPQSLYRRTTECRTDARMAKGAGAGFCSGATP